MLGGRGGPICPSCANSGCSNLAPPRDSSRGSGPDRKATEFVRRAKKNQNVNSSCTTYLHFRPNNFWVRIVIQTKQSYIVVQIVTVFPPKEPDGGAYLATFFARPYRVRPFPLPVQRRKSNFVSQEQAACVSDSCGRRRNRPLLPSLSLIPMRRRRSQAEMGAFRYAIRLPSFIPPLPLPNDTISKLISAILPSP